MSEMMEIAKPVFYLLLFPGFLFTGILGLFFMWVDRKVTALIQSRMGPPWYQCYADIGKLLYKQTIIPAGSNAFWFVLSPLIGLAGITIAATLIWLENSVPHVSFVGDLIVLLYLLILPSLSMIFAGSVSNNPFSAVGASREMSMVVAYELPYIIAIFTLILKVKSILISDIILYQAESGVLIGSLSGVIAFIVVFTCMQAKLTYLPFDIPEAESEIIGGTLAEYSGVLLALFKLTNAIMLVTLPLFLITLFLGGFNINSWQNIVYLVIKYVVILTLIILVKSIHPRLRIDQAIKFFWGPVTILAITGFILALIGV